MLLEGFAIVLTGLFVVGAVMTKRLPSLPAIEAIETEKGLVSIVLPVRNQATTIRECLHSLCRLDYPEVEILVVDGDSNDGTKEIVESFGKRIRTFAEPPLLQGWVGKNWACYNGYLAARGDFLLFTDGDSVHSPSSLAWAMAYMRQSGADLLTLTPKAVLRTFWEKLIMPPVFLLIWIYLGGGKVNDDTSDKALGNGQYLLFKRTVYERIGGHKAVRDKIVEDVSLARIVKQNGYRARAVHAPHAVAVRMYQNLQEIWEGWRKNFHAVNDFRVWKSLLKVFTIFVMLELPFLLFGYGLWLLPTTGLNRFLIWGGLMAVTIWLAFGYFYAALETSLPYVLLLPFAIGIYLAIGVDSILRGITGTGVSWRGRHYTAQQLTVRAETVHV